MLVAIVQCETHRKLVAEFEVGFPFDSVAIVIIVANELVGTARTRIRKFGHHPAAESVADTELYHLIPVLQRRIVARRVAGQVPRTSFIEAPYKVSGAELHPRPITERVLERSAEPVLGQVVRRCGRHIFIITSSKAAFQFESRLAQVIPELEARSNRVVVKAIRDTGPVVESIETVVAVEIRLRMVANLDFGIELSCL